MITTAQTSLVQRVARVQARLLTHGIEPVDMRRAGTLETDLSVPQPMDTETDLTINPLRIQRLEGDIVARQIPRRNESRFRWFLDGSQKTFAIFRIGVVPIVAGTAVVGIIERDEHGEVHLIPETLNERITWFVPTRTESREINALVDSLIIEGEHITDPLEMFADDRSAYLGLSGNYGRMLYYASEQAGKVRSVLEEEALQFWEANVSPAHPEGWLVVDGRLRRSVPNAIGLVKELLTQHLVGEEAVTLFSLPQGHRTTAFRYVGRETPEDVETDANTMWYQRMWPADGVDARHALIRLEAAHSLTDPERIDEIATWLLAERVPRATADGRWATLLYPIHLVELMLKRRLSAITAGWPS